MKSIAEGLSASRADPGNTHWTIWSALCTNVDIDPLLLSYKDRIPILATFAAKYFCRDISASGKNFCYRMVEDSACSIGQELAAIGAKDPRLNSEGVLDIQLNF